MDMFIKNEPLDYEFCDNPLPANHYLTGICNDEKSNDNIKQDIHHEVFLKEEMEESKKRLRAPNFTVRECRHLCDIVHKYKHIIENKKNDAVSLQDKRKAWMDIFNEYNSITTDYARTVDSLQQCYKNLKKKAKKQNSKIISEIPVKKEKASFSLENFEMQEQGKWEKTVSSTAVSQEKCPNMFQKMIKSEKDLTNTNTGLSKRMEDSLLEKMEICIQPIIEDLPPVSDLQSVLSQHKEVESKDCAVQPLSSFPETDSKILKHFPKLTTSSNKKIKIFAPHRLKIFKRNKLILSKKMRKLRIQNEQEKLEHNRLKRSMEIEEIKNKMEHNKMIRKLELQQWLNNNKSTSLEVMIQDRQLERRYSF